jgi:hypothetical protein
MKLVRRDTNAFSDLIIGHSEIVSMIIENRTEETRSLFKIEDGRLVSEDTARGSIEMCALLRTDETQLVCACDERAGWNLPLRLERKELL